MTDYDDAKESFRCKHGKVRGIGVCRVCEGSHRPDPTNASRNAMRISLTMTVDEWMAICSREPASPEKDKLQNELDRALDGISTEMESHRL